MIFIASDSTEVGRSPCGERGLKFPPLVSARVRHSSLPVRGAWIEVPAPASGNACAASLPVRGAWIEMSMTGKHADLIVSLPVRGAWIEIYTLRMSSNPHKSRSPCGERGLKSRTSTADKANHYRRSPCGERGLKWGPCHRPLPIPRRSPCGKRGLKLLYAECPEDFAAVAPRAGSVD